MFTFLMTAANTAFWIFLHFGLAFLICKLPQKTQQKLFDYKKPFFKVSKKQMIFMRKLNLPKWKDKLPQYNNDFDKRHLKPSLNGEYIRNFIFITCRAEIIHLLIAASGYISVLFCLFENAPSKGAWLYILIATIIGLANLPFCLIQRYNRKRLVSLLKRLPR